MCFWLNGQPLVLSLQLNASHSFLLHNKAVFISSFKSDGQNICFCPRINFAIFHWMISKANDFANVAKDVPGILDLIRHSRTWQCKMVNCPSSAPQQKMEWLEQNREQSWEKWLRWSGLLLFCFANYTLIFSYLGSRRWRNLIVS